MVRSALAGIAIMACGVTDNTPIVGQPLTAPLIINVQIPALHKPQDVVLSAAEFLRFNDRTKTGPIGGSEIAGSAGGTYLAAEANIRGSVFANGDVFLGSRSVITGTLTVAGTVTKQDGVKIGAQHVVSPVPFSTVTFSVPLPGSSGGDVRLEPDRTRHLSPGRYGAFDIKSRADIFLVAGVYFFDGFNLEPQAEIFLDTAAGPIQIYVQSSFNFKGAFVQSAGKPEDLFVGYLGSSDAYVQGPFVGTLVAPGAEIALHRPSSNQPHKGGFFGKRIQVFSDATVLHAPFPWGLLIGDPLVGDADFPKVGPQDVPATTPTGSPIDPQCGPEFAAVINPNVDANRDGFPDIVSFRPTPLNPGCLPPTFCQPFTLPNGGEGFAPVAPLPLFHPALPIPAAAVTQGCTGEPAAPVCPVLGSTGTQALGCAALAPDPSCVTVSMCPDPGSWEDPANPDVKRVFDAVSFDSLPFPLPPGVEDLTPGQILQIAAERSPLYINPCEWDPVVNKYNTDIDIRGTGKAGGAPCFEDNECQGTCVKPPGDLSGLCSAVSSPLELVVDEGSSNWNVHFNAGLAEARASVQRVVFFPSAEFDVKVHADALLTATAFGHTFHLYELDILSQLNQCGFNFDWHSKSGDDLFNVINGLIRQGPLGAGVFVPGNVADLNATSDPNATATCLADLAALHTAEKQLNEAFHNALIASTFYNLAGPNGSVITSRAVAQAFIDTYRSAATAYQAALASYDASQQAALDHDVAGQVGDFEIELELAFVRSYGIGPFNPALELGVYGRAGMSGIDMQNTATTHFTGTPGKPCLGIECFELTATGSAAPKAAAGIFLFIGGGVNLVVAGGAVGIRGELDLINAQLPLAGSFAVERATLTPAQLVLAIPEIPDEVKAVVARVSRPADLLVDSLFEVPPRAAMLTAPFKVGAHLQSLGDPLAVEAQFLSGRVKLWAKAWFLFITKKWEKTIVSWQGIPREWHVGDPLSDNAFGTLSTIAGLLAAPNMVLLPKLELLPVPGTADPMSTSNAINAALDTQATDNDGIRFDAHLESELAMPWTLGSAARCSIRRPPG